MKKRYRNYKSDFEEIIIEIKQTGKLPEPPHQRFSIKGYIMRIKG